MRDADTHSAEPRQREGRGTPHGPADARARSKGNSSTRNGGRTEEARATVRVRKRRESSFPSCAVLAFACASCGWLTVAVAVLLPCFAVCCAVERPVHSAESAAWEEVPLKVVKKKDTVAPSKFAGAAGERVNGKPSAPAGKQTNGDSQAHAHKHGRGGKKGGACGAAAPFCTRVLIPLLSPFVSSLCSLLQSASLLLPSAARASTCLPLRLMLPTLC